MSSKEYSSKSFGMRFFPLKEDLSHHILVEPISPVCVCGKCGSFPRSTSLTTFPLTWTWGVDNSILRPDRLSAHVMFSATNVLWTFLDGIFAQCWASAHSFVYVSGFLRPSSGPAWCSALVLKKASQGWNIDERECWCPTLCKRSIQKRLLKHYTLRNIMRALKQSNLKIELLTNSPWGDPPGLHWAHSLS